MDGYFPCGTTGLISVPPGAILRTFPSATCDLHVSSMWALFSPDQLLIFQMICGYHEKASLLDPSGPDSLLQDNPSKDKSLHKWHCQSHWELWYYSCRCVYVGGFLVEVYVKPKALGWQRQRRPQITKHSLHEEVTTGRAGIHPIHPTISPSLAHGFGRVGAGGWGWPCTFSLGGQENLKTLKERENRGRVEGEGKAVWI